ncbi:MAG: DUF4234 domain-containing protein [Propionibacteriales bacterium]|nr:DUF4234 domain-containing protein [Propionibacteriales bacterium]
MTDPQVPASQGQPTTPLAPAGQFASVAPAGYAPHAVAPFGHAPTGLASSGPIGKVRGTGFCVALLFLTLGIYSLVWFYQVHDEMKRHTGQGLGGGVALLLAFFVGIVSPYIASAEIGGLYERRGEAKPVSGATGLWYFPGIFLLVGPIVWFVKTNGALNNYWRSLGAR